MAHEREVENATNEMRHTAAVGWLEGSAVGDADVGDGVGPFEGFAVRAAVVGDGVGLLEGSAVG